MMKKIAHIILASSLFLTLSACGTKELDGITLFSNATNAFNHLESATLKVYSENDTLTSNAYPADLDEEMQSRDENQKNKMFKEDTIKLNIKNGKRISYTESTYNGDLESVSKYYLDHYNKKYYQTNYENKWESIQEGTISKIALTSSSKIYWVEINQDTVEEQNLEKTDSGYIATYTLKPDALKEYTDDFSTKMGIEVTLAHIKLTLKTDLKFIPQSLECSYFRTYVSDTLRYEIDVLDKIEYTDINSTEKLTAPTV